MNLDAITSMEPEQLRALLPVFLAGFIDDDEASTANRERISAEIADWSVPDLRRVLDTLASLGDETRLYVADPGFRGISRSWSQDVVLDPTLSGVEHLVAAVEAGPTAVVCNHLSYFDSNAIDAILAWRGHGALADRLVSAAGPKVYQDLFRRVAAAGINTLPVPQSTSFTHTESLSPRELVRRALASVGTAGAAMSEGFVLLVYAEGSRTRTGRLQPFLPAVRRYLTATPGMRVVPAAITGTLNIMPVGRNSLVPSTAAVRFAEPLLVDCTRDARAVLSSAHSAIAMLLPSEYRPESTPDAAS